MGKSKKKLYDNRYGAKHKGPIPEGLTKSRSCTDVVCLFVFIIFLIAWAVVAVFAFKDGHPDDIFVPFDSKNRLCGVDKEVKDKPYLFYFDLTRCFSDKPGETPICNTPQVCLQKCPSENFNADYFAKGNLEDVEFMGSKLICEEGFDVLSIKNFSDVKNAIDANKCARWYLDSKPVANRCLPRHLSKLKESRNGVNISFTINNAGSTVSDYINNVTSQHIIDAADVIKHRAGLDSFGDEILHDLKNNWKWVVLMVVVSSLLSFLYIIISRWIASFLVWFSFFGCIVLLSYSIYFTWTRYQDKDSDEELFLFLFVVSIIALVILLLMLLIMGKRILLAIALIKEGSRAVTHAWTTLVFPVFPFLCQVIAGAFGTGILVFLLSSDKKDYTDYFHGFNVFMAFWSVLFFGDFGNMVLAFVFCRYYWTFNKKNLPVFMVAQSVYQVIRYHLGTIAFGSLIIALCKLIRYLIKITYNALKDSKKNPILVIIACFCACCCDWITNFLKYITLNSYIMCAMRGTNFVSSAKKAFGLITRNIFRAAAIEGVTGFVFFFNKLLITILSGAISYFLFSNPLPGDNFQTEHYFVPTVFISICAYFIASVFLSVYEMAVDTLFLCFLEDSERNDGSPEKPYFMSKDLLKILSKKPRKVQQKRTK